MRRLLVYSAVLALIGLALVLVVRYYEPAQLALMWVIWIGVGLLVILAGSLGLLDH